MAEPRADDIWRRRYGPIRGLWCAETPNHVHPCPSCYERKPCPFPNCTIVSDFCEPGQALCGGYCVCEECLDTVQGQIEARHLGQGVAADEPATERQRAYLERMCLVCPTTRVGAARVISHLLLGRQRG